MGELSLDTLDAIDAIDIVVLALLLSGVPPHVVSMRLGRRSVAFTLQQYAHVLPQQQADAVERLAARALGEE